MKGIIFNLLEEFITENWGDEKYEEILALCPVHVGKVYVGPSTYADAELYAIAAKAAESLGLTLPDALKAFGRFAFGKLARRYPVFLKDHVEPKSFLLSVDRVIHVEVRKLFKDAVTPSFIYRDTGPESLTIEYQSERKLCSLMEGLILGTSDWFNQPIAMSQSRCLLHGDNCCEFNLTFGKA